MPILIFLVFFVFKVESKDSCQSLKKLKSEVPPNIYYGCIKQKCVDNCHKKEVCSCVCEAYGCLQRTATSQSKPAQTYFPIKDINNSTICINRTKYLSLIASNPKCHR